MSASRKFSFVRRFAPAILAVLTVSCVNDSRPSAPAAQPPEKPAPLAAVNGRQIFPKDLDAFLQFAGEEEGDLDRVDRLSDLVRQEALFQAAEEAGIEISDAETATLLDESEGESAPPSPEFLAQVRRFLTVQKFIQQNIGAEEQVRLGQMQDYYESHAAEFVVDDQLRILEILVKDRTQAQNIRDALKPGDFRSFREAARRSSVGTTAHSGGELGPFQKGQLPKRFESLVFSLRVGEISALFQSELGFHIFTVEERTPRHAQKFYEVQHEIFARMVAQREREAVDRFVADVLDRSSIEIYDDNSKNRSNHHAQALQ